jgi:single-stranded-DNA-specific exonuclease
MKHPGRRERRPGCFKQAGFTEDDMLKWVPRGEAPPECASTIDRLLRVRGFDDPAAAQAFLRPSRDQLGDPFLMPNMRDAVERLAGARREDREVVVYGDYDVDGVTATALLTLFLAAWGVRARHYIPSRHREGYGLNEEAIRKIAAESPGALLVTVDCGVTAAAEIALAKELGLCPIVTDHHRPGGSLPDCPVLNPLLGYPHPHLCGAGVAFKLCQALDDGLAFPFIDLAALATVADVVPLTGENRAITFLGIRRMNEAPRPGIAALMAAAGVAAGAVTSGRIAFQLAPRLNAGGRVGDAVRSLRLLTAETIEEAEPLAAELENENAERKRLEGEILSGAEAQLEGFDFPAKRSIVLAGEDWNAGVLGLAASRLVERYNLPTVLLRREGETLHGSCRSIPGVDIHEALSAVSGLLTRFGGHSQAAGLSLPAERLDAFRQALDETIARTADPECFVPAARYDMALPLSKLDESFVRSLSMFEPTGYGNPAPVFLAEAAVESGEAVGANGAHLRLRLSEGGRSLPGVAFSMGGLAKALPRRIRALYAPQMGCFREREYLECQVKAIGQAGYLDAFLALVPDFDGLFQTFLTNRFYNKAYSIPAAGLHHGYGEILSQLCASPRGALVLAATAEAAQAFLEAAQSEAPDRMDLFAGSWPGDRRAFNAFCLLPPGPPPPGYDRVYSLDAPGAFWGYPVTEPERPAPLGAPFPDVEELRRVYVAARDLARRPLPVGSAVDALAKDLMPEGAMRRSRVQASLLVLADMNLIELSEKTGRFALLPSRKADPLENPVFQWMRQLSQWGGEPQDA